MDDCKIVNQTSVFDFIALQTVPAFVLAGDYADGTVSPFQSHQIGQLLYTLTGVVMAETPGRAWAIPPGRAMWISPGIEHRFKMSGSVCVRTLYVASDAVQEMPVKPCVVRISPLVRELIERAMSDGHYGTTLCVQSLVMPLLLTELGSMACEELSLPLPSSATMVAFAKRARYCAKRDDIPTMAASIGMTAKTFARRFRRETGMSPDLWRRRARLLDAIAQLREGRRITDVAHTAGYDSSASFAAAFKKTFGMTPTQARSAV
jgi:AraC-like DNA-binding protein